MPINTITRPYGQHVVGNTKLLIPVIDKHGQLVSVVGGSVGVSYPFIVADQPMTLVASNFQDHPSDILQVQVSPEGTTWQDLWIHGTAIQLTPHNSLIHISVPGTYRLVRPGWFVLPPDIAPPSNPLQKSTASGWYGTLTHEPALGLIPEVGSIGPQGEVGPQGVPGAPGEPPTALFIIASTAPDVHQYPHGAAWWDLDNGRAFILYDDGTSKQWVEFIGSPGIANFIIASTAPPVYSYVPGSAWWDADNGRVFILYDDGSSRQWVEFIGSPSPGGGGSGAQGPQGDIGAQGPQGAVGAQGPQGAAGTVMSGGGGMTLISSQIVSAPGVTNITFAAIPSTFKELLLIYQAANTDGFSGLLYGYVRINGDNVAANYYDTLQTVSGNGGGSPGSTTLVATTDGMPLLVVPGSQSNPFPVGSGKLLIPNYTGTVFRKTFHSEVFQRGGGGGAQVGYVMTGGCALVAAVTQIEVITPILFGTGFLVGSTFNLYGIG